jgi:hypothetical protein
MTGTRPSAPVPSVLLVSPVVLLSTARAVYGLALLAAPGPILAVLGGDASRRRNRAVARVLGARHVTQAVVTVAAGGQAMAPGAVVDSLHATSMVWLASRRGTPQRAELADAALASLLAVLGAVAARAGARHGC